LVGVKVYYWPAGIRVSVLVWDLNFNGGGLRIFWGIGL
jgi:hypothetical protein